ncbi:branched-subunit amino acid transport protein AzlD [Mycobacterium sp. OTB74]|nr:branched-subunit amino acid transport protein AzlD [Mycobacterium sp. OTB74]
MAHARCRHVGLSDLALRAVPFAILQPLRKSHFVNTMATWMPVGIVLILAASTFR